jgi:hypothetical protein
MKKVLYLLTLCALVTAIGCGGSSKKGRSTAPIASTFTGLTANGTSGSTTTSQLILTFSVDPTTLTIDDISLTGAEKDTLTGNGLTRTLSISGITVANEQNVTVHLDNPEGFTITPDSKTVAVNVAAVSTAVVFSALTANGVSNSTTTTELTLIFDINPTSLAADDITVTGAAKGTLHNISGTTWRLSISGITVANGAGVTVAMTNPAGFTITPSSKTVAVNVKPTAVAFSGLTANGTSGTTTTSQLILTFDVNPASLVIADIEVTGATKGDLTGAGSTRTLTVSDITVANGENITVTLTNPSGFAITPSSKTVSVNVAAVSTAVVFSTLTANGSSYSAVTTELTLTFDVNPTSLTAGDITVTGAAKGTLSYISGTTWTLAISDITVGNGADITVALANPDGFTVSPTSKTVAVYLDPTVINIAEIPGVIAPVTGAAPVTVTTATIQYTGEIAWSPAAVSFGSGTAYTATITLTPQAGYTLTGVAADFFTVTGATTVANSANSGVITAGFPATAFTGSGTALNPYLIYTLAQLVTMRDNVNSDTAGTGASAKVYKLMADIDLNVSPHNATPGWIPIGTSVHPFKGIFYGNGKVISNLYINAPTASNQGLFGSLNGGTINDLGLNNVSVSAKFYVGGLAGQISSSSVINNCYVTGAGTITGAINGNNTGGLVGMCSAAGGSSPITNCYSTVIVDGNQYSGGLVGSNNDSYVGQCYATGSVTGTIEGVGGLVGYNSGTIENSYSSGAVTSSVTSGGFVGINRGPLTNCYETGAINSTAYWTGGLVGSHISGSYTSCFYITTSTTLNTVKGTEKTSAELKTQSTFTGWDFDSIWGTDGGYPKFLKNYALGCSFFESGHYFDAPPSELVDNSFATDSAWCSGGYGGWFTIDLGLSKTIKKIRLYPQSATTSTVTFSLEGSNDNAAWTTIANPASSSSVNGVPTAHNYTSPELNTAYRYVRFTAISWPSSWVAVWEFQVFGM